jgi:hypothetical protein
MASPGNPDRHSRSSGRHEASDTHKIAAGYSPANFLWAQLLKIITSSY